MKLEYSAYTIVIKPEDTLKFDTMPEFLFRSVIGMELKNLSCLFKQRKCEECDLKFQCAYSVIFESPINKDNAILEGRNYASHPFVLSVENNEKTTFDKIELNITLVGKAIDYFPYLFYAVSKGGETGIGRERVKYSVESVKHEGNEIFKDGQLNIDMKRKEWIAGINSGRGAKRNYLVEFVSPLRLKKHGKYVDELDYEDFLNAVIRRMNILCGLYGHCEKNPEKTGLETFNKKNLVTNIRWVENKRWSGRQKRTMLLGGIKGTIELSGNFTPFERSLLEAGELFHLGKNAGFGLGRIKVRELR
jgi:hypothetical protein